MVSHFYRTISTYLTKKCEVDFNLCRKFISDLLLIIKQKLIEIFLFTIYLLSISNSHKEIFKNK